MKNRALLLLFAAFLVPGLRAQNDVTKASIRTSIDVLFGKDSARTAQTFPSWTYPVNVGNGTTDGWRGALTARQCACLAVAYAVAKNDDAAMSWLCAASDQDAFAIDHFLMYRVFPITYLVGTYREQGLAMIDMPPVATDAKVILGAIHMWLLQNHPEARPKSPYKMPIILPVDTLK